MFDFLKKEKEEVSILIDIGNGSIAGAFVLFREGEVPKLLYSIRLPFSISEKPSTSKMSKAMFELLDEVVASMIKHGFQSDYLGKKSKKPSSALITFSSPWFISKTKQIHVSNDTPFIITEDFLNNLVTTEEKIFEKELSKDFDTNKKSSFEVIEKSVVNTKVNGYTLTNIIGKKTKIFDAFLCMSIILSDTSEKVRNIILKHTHISEEKMVMYSFPLVSFSTIRDIFSADSDFIIMDVTGEVTDITLVTDNVIRETASMPTGRNFVIREIAKTFNISPEIALSTLHMFISKKADDSVNLRMQEVLIKIEKEWKAYFEDALLLLSKEILLPEKVYLTADADMAEIFMDFLKMPTEDSTSAFRKNADIIHINHNILSALYRDNSGMFEDEFIALLAIFCNKLLQNQ